MALHTIALPAVAGILTRIFVGTGIMIYPGLVRLNRNCNRA